MQAVTTRDPAHQSPPPFLGEADLAAALPVPAAIAALRRALRAGLDPDSDPARAVVPVGHGQLLLMPAQQERYVGVKIASVAPANPGAGLPRIQGHYLLFDARTLTPLALIDGVALTLVRTAAVSAVAANALAAEDAEHLVIFGTGPQASSHLDALRAVRPLSKVTVVGRTPERALHFADVLRRSHALDIKAGERGAIATADLIACCTTARTPLFDGSRLPRRATVIAIGSHEPDAREVDTDTVSGSTVVVESRDVALREAGDVIHALNARALVADDLVSLASLETGRIRVDTSRPRLFKSVGMAWEDLVLASAAYEAIHGN